MKKNFLATPNLLTSRPSNFKMTLGIKLVGRRIIHFFWLFGAVLLGGGFFGASHRLDLFAHNPSPHLILPSDSAPSRHPNDVLRRIRLTPRGINQELALMRSILTGEPVERVLAIDPVTEAEALQLAEYYGERSARELSILIRLKKAAGTTSLDPNVEEALLERARQSFRYVIAVAHRLESPTEKAQNWFHRHKHAWYFLGEVISISAAVLGADLALKSGSEMLPTILGGLGLSVGTVGGIFLPVFFWQEISRSAKFNRVFKAFFRGVDEAGLDPEGLIQLRKGRMQRMATRLGYPDNFVKCAIAIGALK